MKIILNADDFGFSDETVDATIECFERGALTSATIMPNMSATARAVEYALTHPEYSFGIHLTFVTDTSERPLLNPDRIPQITDAYGRFLSSKTVRIKGLLNLLPQDQIEAELIAQLNYFKERELKISHVDSHKHLHKYASFRKVLWRVLPRFGVDRLRTAQDIYVRKPLTSLNRWIGPVWRRKIRRCFRTTEHFYMPTAAGDPVWWNRLPLALPGNSLEIGIHPGRIEPWRDRERQNIIAFAERVRQNGHSLINWNEL
jgi:hypothetical protein